MSTRVVQQRTGAQVLPPVGDWHATISGWHAHCAADADLRAKSPWWAKLAAGLVVEDVPS